MLSLVKLQLYILVKNIDSTLIVTSPKFLEKVMFYILGHYHIYMVAINFGQTFYSKTFEDFLRIFVSEFLVRCHML